MAAKKSSMAAKAKHGGRVSEMRAGLSLGLLFAAFQIAWGMLLLATGGSAAGQMYRMSMLSMGGAAYAGFDLAAYAEGVALSYALGFVCGSLFAYIWNSLKD